MFAMVRPLGLSKKQVDVVFDKDWLGFKKGHETTVFEYVAEKLIKQGVAHLRSGSVVNDEIKVKKLVKVEVEKSETEESEQKGFKRPPKDKMIKRATVSK